MPAEALEETAGLVACIDDEDVSTAGVTFSSTAADATAVVVLVAVFRDTPPYPGCLFSAPGLEEEEEEVDFDLLL